MPITEHNPPGFFPPLISGLNVYRMTVNTLVSLEPRWKLEVEATAAR